MTWLSNPQAAAIFGYAVEWDVCPGCGQMFPAQYGSHVVARCDSCDDQPIEPEPAPRNRAVEWEDLYELEWAQAFDDAFGVPQEVPPPLDLAPSDGAGDGSTLSTTVQRIATNSPDSTERFNPDAH